MQKKLAFPIFVLIFLSCGLGNSNVESDSIVETSFDDIAVEETTTTSSTTSSTSTTTVYVCTPEDNSNIDFDNIKNIQNFLNRYGYNAGDEDGYLGNQTLLAIKEFQSFAGLKPDGDPGPATRNAMNNWTGCEEQASEYVASEETPQENISNSESTTTTSTSTTSTTTTIPSENVSNSQSEFGYQPSVLLTSNQITSVFRGLEDSTTICGVPYINNLDANSINLYQNGLLQYSTVGNSTYTESTATAEIVNVAANTFTINVNGNGDTNFKFYFIKPFESDITLLAPSTITTSSGLTTAVFDKNGLEQGYWFFSFAENNSGEIVKSVGLREILISDELSQTQSPNNEIDTIFFLKDKQNISRGLNLNGANNVELFYTTKNLYDSRDDTTTAISESVNTITLKNDGQASAGQILHIGRELMLVTAKNGSTYTVERGYLSTQKQSHPVGTSVRVIQNTSKQSIQSSFAYAVIRSEQGIRYQVSLGSELSTNQLSTSNCPNGLYSFEEITIFSWRPRGSSVTYSSTKLDRNNPIFDKQFLINNSFNYSPPTLNSKDVDGNFVNSGPSNINILIGDIVRFDFSGIVPGTNIPKFAELKFTMNPYGSSGKLSKSRSIFIEISNNYIFEININNIISSSSFKSDVWESGYKYIFDSLILYDNVSKTTFKSNQEVIYDYTSSKSTHEAYYLDQFIFNVP